MMYLDNNNGFSWHCGSSIAAKGYLYYKNQYLDADGIIKLYKLTHTENDFIEILSEYDGCYAIIIEREEHVYAAVDRIRSIPLFYTKRNNELIILDSITPDFVNENALEIDDIALSEFKGSGYTIGGKTLLRGVHQLQAGQALIYKNNELKTTFYHRHYHATVKSSKTYQESLMAFRLMSKNIFTRLVNSCGERKIAVPLSGGYDSRYIVSMLKELNCQNVICYTYGKQGSFEVEIAERVAKTLGYEWHFVEYTNDKWPALLADERYHLFASNYSSAVLRQEYVAIKELKDAGIIDNSTIIIPGFCGDLLGGSYVPEPILQGTFHFLKKRGLRCHIFDINFDLHYNPGNIDAIQKNISEDVGAFSAETENEFISGNEEFFTRHKVAKFVVNSVRVYEYFGMEWRLPLWDKELCDFWLAVDFRERIHNRLFNNLLFDTLFVPHKIDHRKKGAGRIKMAIDKSAVLARLYIFFRPLIKQVWRLVFEPRKYINYNNSDSLSNLIKEEYPESSELKKLEHVNAISIFWYLKLISRYRT